MSPDREPDTERAARAGAAGAATLAERICFVVNTCGRDVAMVETAITSILCQSPRPGGVVLVDQNSPPLALANALIANPILAVQPVPTPCVSVARNAARLPDACEWIVFIDDDARLDGDYLSRLLETIQGDKELAIVAGAIVGEDGCYYTLRHRVGDGRYSGLELDRFSRTKLLMGSNFAIRRAVFDALGRFDPRFGAGCRWGSGEETDLAWRACFAAVPGRFVPALGVIHPSPDAAPGPAHIAKAFRYGLGKGALVAKWLWLERRPVVVLELVEMVLVPPAKCLLDLLRLRPWLALARIASLAGRGRGFLAFSLQAARGRLVGKRAEG